MRKCLFSLVIAFTVVNAGFAEKPKIVVGSKIFAESYILAEIFSQIIDSSGEATAVRKFGLGQTGIAYEALSGSKIDLYPEYTGTISESILKNPSLTTIAAIREALRSQGLTIGGSLGFKDTYALAVKEDFAKKFQLKKISDLRRHPDIKIGLSHEFMNRSDGYPKLKTAYDFDFKKVHAIAHGLAYQALAKGEIELTDIYSTDAMVQKLNLRVLQDDRSVFPDYSAVIFARDSLAIKFPVTWRNLNALVGKISEKEMICLNARAELEKKSFADIASEYLKNGNSADVEEESLWHKLWVLTKQHLYLVGVSLLASTIVGVPLGVVARQYKILGQIILIFSGVVQTIPSLALLCFLIPLFGIGTTPALVALFLYGLLPIVRSTYVGLTSLDPRLGEVSRALGLNFRRRLFLIELPMASPSIMGGIRTSAIINVGTTTLAALIGAGGYGVPIVTGLALNDIPTILEGAIPAAVLALAVHGVFELLDRMVIPKGIR
jgi:osmoprotectant transport system permease protein